MNTKLITWIVSILLGTIVVGVVWYFVFIPKTPLQTTSSVQPQTTFPSSGTVTNVTSGATAPGINKIAMTLRDGTTAIANDFLHNGVTLPDVSNAGKYLLAGNFGTCWPDTQKCQVGPPAPFTVYYNAKNQGFVINLSQEPIGQARIAAEQFMSTELGLTQGQMCNLNYLVGTTRYVNEQYADSNLGFSFCPGATVLPK